MDCNKIQGTNMMIKRAFQILLLSATGIAAGNAQTPDLTDGIKTSVEMSGTLSDGHYSPLWLNANKYGLSSIERNSGYIRGGVYRSAVNDSLRKWDVGYGVDIAVAANHSSTFRIQQLYADVKWMKGLLTVGQKQQPMQLKNNELSSGSQTLGINSLPYPEIRLALPNYWHIPGTKGFLSIKGHVAYGMLTDNSFEKDFVHGTSSYNKNTLMHSKAGYLKLGKDEKPFSVEAGVEMASQFGGTRYAYSNGTYKETKLGSGLSSFWHAFAGGGSDSSMDGAIKNNEGNMLGSWLLRVNYETKTAKFGLYADQFFEDHSGMFHLDYDGYANENGKIVKKDNKYLFYPLKDIMLGADMHLKNFRYISDVVVEYMYTKYQSGPVYVDRTLNFTDHIGGRDDYYNNSTFSGWQHWGRAIGNPLYISPEYNTDGSLSFQCNRFVAWHLGMSGNPTDDLHYRLLTTIQNGWGTYRKPYIDPRNNFSFALEASYNLHKLYEGVSIGAAFGFDRGQLLGNNTGGTLTIKFER